MTTEMLRRIISDRSGNLEEDLEDIVALHEAILDYFRRLGVGEIEMRDQLQRDRLLDSANQIFAMADTVRINLVPLEDEWRERGLHPKAAMWQYAFITMITVLAPTVGSMATGQTASDKFLLRLFYFTIIAGYGWLAL